MTRSKAGHLMRPQTAIRKRRCGAADLAVPRTERNFRVAPGNGEVPRRPEPGRWQRHRLHVDGSLGRGVTLRSGKTKLGLHKAWLL